TNNIEPSIVFIAPHAFVFSFGQNIFPLPHIACFLTGGFIKWKTEDGSIAFQYIHPVPDYGNVFIVSLFGKPGMLLFSFIPRQAVYMTLFILDGIDRICFSFVKADSRYFKQAFR